MHENVARLFLFHFSAMFNVRSIYFCFCSSPIATATAVAVAIVVAVIVCVDLSVAPRNHTTETIGGFFFNLTDKTNHTHTHTHAPYDRMPTYQK